MAGSCRNDIRISNERVTFTGGDKPLECYGYRDDRTPACRWLNRCRCENGLQPFYGSGKKVKKTVTGRQCLQCAEYDSCFKLGGENGVARACKYFRKGN